MSSKRFIFWIVGVIAVGVLSLVGVAGAANPAPPQLAAQQAATVAAINAPARGPINATVRRISPAAAIAAASEPGADTETAQGQTVQQAVGIAVGAAPQSVQGSRSLSSAHRAAGSGCWWASLPYTWGTWPYQQTVINNTSWCGNGSVLTYRSTHVTLDGYFCGYHDAYGYRVGGGVGQYAEYETVGGYFDCPTNVPWITLHFNRAHTDVVTGDGQMWRT